MDLELFWTIEQEVDGEDKNWSLKVIRSMRNILVCYMIYNSITTIFFLSRPFFLQQKVTVFNGYIPENVPYFILSIQQSLAFIVLYLVCTTFDIFYATVIVVMKIQFHLLNHKIQKALDMDMDLEGNKRLYDERMAELVRYHNFLLR